MSEPVVWMDRHGNTLTPEKLAEAQRLGLDRSGYSIPLYDHPAPSPDEARPLDEWHEDNGTVTWWKLPVEEPAWIGTPLDSDWPGYHTHWTPHPAVPINAEVQEATNG